MRATVEKQQVGQASSQTRGLPKVVFVPKPSAGDLKEIGSLRAEVWAGEGVYVKDFSGGDDRVWLDELDQRSAHWMVYADGMLIASARVSIHQQLSDVPDYEWIEPAVAELQEPIGSIMRLVVHKDYRKQGIARVLDQLRLEYLKSHHVDTIVGIAVGCSRIDALKKIGFQFKFMLPLDHGLMEPNFPLGVLIYR